MTGERAWCELGHRQHRFGRSIVGGFEEVDLLWLKWPSLADDGSRQQWAMLWRWKIDGLTEGADTWTETQTGIK